MGGDLPISLSVGLTGVVASIMHPYRADAIAMQICQDEVSVKVSLKGRILQRQNIALVAMMMMMMMMIDIVVYDDDDNRLCHWPFMQAKGPLYLKATAKASALSAIVWRLH